MAKPRQSSLSDAPPSSYPEVPPPRNLHDTSDIRFVMIEMGKFETKLDRLIQDVAKSDTKLSGIERAVDRVKTGLIVASTILAFVGMVFWWMLGDRITNAVRSGLFSQTSGEVQTLQSAPASRAPSVQTAPK